MRRDELENAGIHLPVLATVCAGPLPQPGNWAARLDRLGLDVITTGAPWTMATVLRPPWLRCRTGR